MAATLTALAAFNAALLDGDALKGYTNSTRSLNDANYFYSAGNQTYAGDQSLFVAYASATQSGDAELAAYLQTLMRPEMSAAIDWWLATDEADTPFDELDGNPYVIPDFDEASTLEARASAEFDDGAAADDKGDKFELATVLLALTLFFGGIATLFAKRSVSVALLGVGLATLAGGVVQLAVAFTT